MQKEEVQSAYGVKYFDFQFFQFDNLITIRTESILICKLIYLDDVSCQRWIKLESCVFTYKDFFYVPIVIDDFFVFFVITDKNDISAIPEDWSPFFIF